MKTTWVIIGAASIIAKSFANLAAQNGCDLIIIGRSSSVLETFAADLIIRYKVNCQILIKDLALPTDLNFFKADQHYSLFIAQSLQIDNSLLQLADIEAMINVNVTATLTIIYYYLQQQQPHQIIFLSSVAAGRGRKKNSLYGGTKALIEVYLQGLQQQYQQAKILIMKLGYIDTVNTYGKKGIFYAASPDNCASACWHALTKGKTSKYYPFFWRYIMWIIKLLPDLMFRKMKF